MNNLERIEGPTPMGGAYALVYYQSFDGEPIEKNKAVRAEIMEFSSSDKPIAISILDLSSNIQHEI